jgi:DNA-binding protein YbaB
VERPDLERPDWAGLSGMVDDLRSAMHNMDDTRRKMLQVTGTAWSPDRTVKVVVGPRGHLVGLEIDPRVYRKPNSVALAESIVATAREAIEQVLAKTQDIVDASVPGDLRIAKVGSLDVRELALTHDADLAIEEDDNGHLR